MIKKSRRLCRREEVHLLIMKKETAILTIVVLVVVGFLFFNKIKLPQKSAGDSQETPTITPIEDLSATVLPTAEKSTTSLLALPPLGNPIAPVKIFIFADYQCPFCKKLFDESETKIRNEFISKGLAVIYFKDYAFLGEESLLAANAARCANEQGKFWEYHDLLFTKQGGENSGAFSKENLKTFAKEIELDAIKFNECVDKSKYKDLVVNDTKNGTGLGIKGTPYLFINKQTIEGAYPYGEIRTIILKELQNR